MVNTEGLKYDWQIQYCNYIQNSYDKEGVSEYDLAYVSSNTIPELFELYKGKDGYNIRIYTYDQDEKDIIEHTFPLQYKYWEEDKGYYAYDSYKFEIYYSMKEKAIYIHIYTNDESEEYMYLNENGQFTLVSQKTNSDTEWNCYKDEITIDEIKRIKSVLKNQIVFCNYDEKDKILEEIKSMQ